MKTLNTCFKKTLRKDQLNFNGDGLSQMAVGSANVVNFVFWLLVLALLSWWVASFCFVPYVICGVLTPCFNFLKPLTDLLLAGVMLPYKASDNMVHQRSYNSF